MSLLPDLATLLRNILDLVSEAVYIKDRTGHYVLANQPVAQMFGVNSPADVIGKTAFDFLSPEEAVSLREMDHQVVQSGEPVLNVEYHSTLLNGGTIWVNLCKYPLYDDDGHIFGILGVNTLIDRLKQTEAALNLSEERYRMISQMISDFAYFYRFMPDGTVVREWTTESFRRVMGYNTDEITHDQVDLIVHADDVEVRRRDLERLKRGEAVTGEYRFYTKSGQERWLRISRQPVISSETGEVIAYYGAAKDITDEKQAEQHQVDVMLERERLTMLNELVGNMSHDLKVPLAVMRTSIYMLEREPGSQYRIDVLKQQVTHLESLIDDILTIARLDYQHRLTLESLNLNAIIQEVLDDMQALAINKEIRIDARLSNPLCEIAGDMNELYHLVMNLIENAVNYTPQGGSIILRTYCVEQYAMLEVEDTGIGIEEDQLSRIFERFYRTDRARQMLNISGTGLGLAIVQRVVEMHGGSIDVRSVVNQGTIFVIALPKAESPRANPSV